MKELDFDTFVKHDAGKAFYRGLFIYGAFLTFKKSS